MKIWLVLGAVGMALAVALGAFGAHGLKARLAPDLMAIYQTAVQYHVYHALGLLGVGLIARAYPDARGIRWAGAALLAGIVLFSGSLYLLALTDTRWLGAITPLGGLAFLGGWLTLAVSVWRQQAG